VRFFGRRRPTPESWYEPRRHDLTTGIAVVAGVIGAFYAGATRWEVLSDPDYSFAWSFAKYEAIVGFGAVAFAAAGAAIGWVSGELWERWHRRRRAKREAAAAPMLVVPSHESQVTSHAAPAVQTSASYDSIPRFGELYDAIPAYGARKDMAFYVDCARRTGGPVLELGCGTGRVLLPIARAGISITGVDGSRLMLDRCREKLAAEPEEVRARVSLHLADGAEFSTTGKFPLVIAPFRVLQQLATVEHQLAFLKNAARHLAPGGWLVFDVFNPYFRALTADRSQEASDTPEFTLPDGRKLKRTYRVPNVRWIDQVSETELIYYVTEPGAGTQRYVQGFEMRWYTRAELEHLLARAGLRATAVYGDFDRSALTDVSPELVFRAEHAGA
jgi:SAM-dependent methyltransferase